MTVPTGMVRGWNPEPVSGKPMTDDEINTTTAKKSIALQTTLCANGVINCSSALGSGDAHSVHVSPNGQIEKCTCKGWTYHGHCYHTDTIRADRSLLSAARATATAARTPVRADGGHVETETDDETEEDPRFLLPTDPDHEPEPSTVELHRCPGCSSLTQHETCGRTRCEGAEVDDTPL